MTEPTWVSGACTLPSRERPLRVAEFDGLFADALRSWERPAAGQLRLTLEAGCEAELRDLTARETACCSFFTFIVRREGQCFLTLEISVPAAQEAVLDALSARLPYGTSPQRDRPPTPNVFPFPDAGSSADPASADATGRDVRPERPGGTEDPSALPEPPHANNGARRDVRP